MTAHRDGPPSQPKTAQLPAADPVQVLLRQLNVSMEAGFAGLRADVGLVSNDLGLLKDRVVLVEKRVADSEERAARTSARVQGASVADLAQEARLADEIIRNRELSSKQEETHALTVDTASKVDGLVSSQDLQLAVLQRIDRLFNIIDAFRKHPLTKVVATVLTLALGGYAASKGIAK